MPLLFVPECEALFWWGHEPAPRLLGALIEGGAAHVTTLITPHGREQVPGRTLALLESLQALAVAPAAELETLSASVACWVLASKLSLALVAHERVVPTIRRVKGRIEARWAAALAGSEDAAKLLAIARFMPASAHAVPAADGGEEVWAPDALLRAFVDASVDALVRGARGGPQLPRAKQNAPSWQARFGEALSGPAREFAAQGFGERTVVEDVERWSAAAVGARDRLRACFRLELPAADDAPFELTFLLQSPDDPSLIVSAAEVWSTRGSSLAKLGRAFRDPQECLLEALARAARLFAPLGRALEDKTPQSLPLEPATVWTFLSEGASQLTDAGFGVIVPSELTAAGQRRLRLRMRVGGKSTQVAGAVSGVAGLGMDELLTVDWDAVIGDHALSARELAALAAQKAPLVRFRGAWVAVDPGELGEIRRRIEAGPSQLSAREALTSVLAGEAKQNGLSVVAAASGRLAHALEQLREGAQKELTAPAALRGTLRPYQQRGLGWLVSMATLGLGACLADDMGLGKTLQLLAFLLHRVQSAPPAAGPALLVAPTSVVGNWERELERFAPSLRLVPHYGAERARTASELTLGADALVLTTYGLLRRDAALLAEVPWAVVALDEAQNIKNAASATARAARSLGAGLRFALTGTPVENRLAELWSILEFANPGLLGPLETFRRDFAVPIERYANQTAAARLRRIVSPFVLRRLKSDPAVISDLPAKNEMKVVCSLTREQATLYKAVVDEELRRIEDSTGIERRGRVLALLTFTKQICNHPAQYLADHSALPGRSGKLARVTEMLEEAVAAGDKALVFTQFRDMGDKLVAHLSAALGGEVLFLHGGTQKRARDELVRRFQEEPHGPRIFVLSVKAGGTGLNLTAASHVFHYDRWWNPAVEDQATDRAYRIGQKRAVQVHKLLCAGTVEEKIDRLLEQKRELADKVVGSGEQWITELGSHQLRELFALSDAGSAVADEETEPAPPTRKRAKRAAVKP